MTREVNRRRFLKSMGATGAAIAAAPMFVPKSAFGANERVVLGIIGPGGRGRSLMREFKGLGAEFAAVCDVYEPNLKAGAEEAKASGKAVTEYLDYRDLLDQSDLDAVVIATPEHQHAHQLVDTVEAGFDSYCEKPMSHSIEEGTWIVKKVRKTDRIVQVGMQRRSSPVVRAGKEVMDSGILGKVTYVRVKWNWNHLPAVDNSPLEGDMDSERWKMFCRPARWIEFEPKKFRHWRYFWKFSGGNITDQGTHLMDVVQWYMGEEFNPAIVNYAECFGGLYKMEGIETPDVFTSIYQYDNFIANWALNYASSYMNSWSIEFMGIEGTMVVDDRGMRVYDEPWSPTENSMLESGKAPVKTVPGGLGSIEHVQNFLDCIKSRNEPNAPVEIGHKAVTGPHLANVAYHRKERAYLNDKATRVNIDWWPWG